MISSCNCRTCNEGGYNICISRCRGCRTSWATGIPSEWEPIEYAD